MKADDYLKKATKPVYNWQVRNEVREELNDCIEDLTEEFLRRGLTYEEAEERAVRQMGEPGEIAIQFHRIYRPQIEWREVIWILAWALLIGGTKLSGLLMGPALIGDGKMIQLIGAMFLAVGVCDSAVEKYMDLPFLYAWAENWGAAGVGGLANASLFAAVGIGLCSRTVQDLLGLLVIVNVVMQIQRVSISRLRQRKEQRYLWEIGTAEEAFNYQGKVRIGDETKKVRIKRGQTARKGETVIITGIDGFRLLSEIL